jgi:hypothetical protein
MRILVEPSDYVVRNVGDMAMLRTAVSRLATCWPNATIQILSDEPDALRAFRQEATSLASTGRRRWLTDEFIPGRHKALPFRVARLKHRTTLVIELLSSGRYRELLSELDVVRHKDPSVMMVVALFALTLIGRACRWSSVKVWRAIMSNRKNDGPRPFFGIQDGRASRPELPPTMTFWLAVLGLFDHFCADSKGYFPRPQR